MTIGVGDMYFEVVRRDEAGWPTEVRRIPPEDVRVVWTQDRNTPGAEVIGYAVQQRTLRAERVVMLAPDDVIEQATSTRHACARLAELDCYAALGDTASARLARWHAAHPDGPQTPEDYAEEAAVWAGYMKRRTG